MSEPLFVKTFPIRWVDMDALGHVNNSQYMNYASETRIDWLRSLDKGDMVINGIGPVIVHTEVSFLKPVVFPAVIEDRMFIAKVGKSSFTARHEIRCVGSPDLYAETHSTIVWVNYAEEKSVPLPEWLKSALEAKVAADSNA